MTPISTITLPGGEVLEIVDAAARQMIAGGLQFIICWDGASTPDITKIPAGVSVVYNETTYTGIMAASSAQALSFYLVYSGTQKDAKDKYDEYVAIRQGAGTEQDPYVYSWEKIGDTLLDLSDLGALAYKDAVNFSKGDGDFVLGEDTTFQNAASNVSFDGRTTDKVLGKDTTFAVTQPSVSLDDNAGAGEGVEVVSGIQSASASGAAVGADGTEDCVTDIGNPTTQSVVKTLSVEKTKKLVKTQVPNVTAAGSASNWGFSVVNGSLVISGGNGSAPTLGIPIDVATGALDAQGGGDAVVTDVSAGSTADAVTGMGTLTKKTVLKGVKVTAQPTISVVPSTKRIKASASGAAVSANNDDEVTAVTNVGTGTAAAQSITVGTNDKVKVAKHGDLSVSVS